MPLQTWMELISVDDHLIEHPRVWSDRLPRKYLDAGPKIIEHDPAGTGRLAQVWEYEGRIYPYIGLNAVAGKKPEDYGVEPMRYSDMIPGCYDPKARVADMDIDGVQAMTCFPSFPRFAGAVFAEGDDDELAKLCSRAWNDFHIDEWAATAPDRFIPLSIVPFWDVEASVKEIYRVAEKGARCVSFPDLPEKLGLPSVHSEHWDPVLSAIEDTGLVLAQHFGSGGFPPPVADDAPLAVFIALMGTVSMTALTNWLFSHTLDRHPKLKIGLSEGGIGWLPYILERCDSVWRKHRFYNNVNQEHPPSVLFENHFHGCFIEDDFGVEVRHHIGIDRITWECDYPHSDSFWPGSRERAAQALKDVPDNEVHSIVELNARGFYNFPRVA